MLRKLTLVSLIVGLCLMSVVPVLAQKTYSTLAEYEKLTGNKIEKFNEAPGLKLKVATGELPPVEERISEEPLVVKPLKEIGRYGGVLKGVAPSPTTGGGDVHSAQAQYLFRLSPDFTVIPNIAKDWDLSKDLKTLTVYLRKGMKWSDGAPFTADDFLFWYKDIILNDELTPVKPKGWSPGGELMQVEKVDDYTVRFQFSTPYPFIVDVLTVSEPFAPGHFLKQYHIKYNPKANEIAKEEGYDYWWMCFGFHNMTAEVQQDIGRPSLNHWILKKIDSYGNRYFERNTYFWKVDTAGNQLPYIDTQERILVDNREVLNLKTIAGEFSYVCLQLVLPNYPLYKQGEKKGNYHTELWEHLTAAEPVYSFNLTHKDPVLRKIFNDIRWKQAMSLAINREEINQTFYFGKGVPRQATAIPGVSFYEPWMGEYYAEYDPERANKLLDEMGLKWDKNHQYRLRPDGKTLSYTLEYAPDTAVAPDRVHELIKEYWEKIGVKVALKEESWALFRQRGLANERDGGAWGLGRVSELAVRINGLVRFYPPWSAKGNPISDIEWWNWYNTGGETGVEPPEVVKKLFRLVEEWQQSLPGTKEYMELGKEILTINVKNLFTIGTVGLVPRPVYRTIKFPFNLRYTSNSERIQHLQ